MKLKKWDYVLIKATQSIDTPTHTRARTDTHTHTHTHTHLHTQKIMHGGNAVFLYYILNWEMINYRCVPAFTKALNAFTKHFQKNFGGKSPTKITNKSYSFDGGFGFKTLIIWNLSSNWLHTEKKSPKKILIMTLYINLFFSQNMMLCRLYVSLMTAFRLFFN